MTTSGSRITDRVRTRTAPGMIACAILLTACASRPDYPPSQPLTNAGYLPAADVQVQIASLSHCTSEQDTDLKLNSGQPVTVIVHGCFASAGRFRSLADVFAFHGQQTVCFNYDDRESLELSSAKLIRSLEELSKILPQQPVQLLGHSQGGLIARRALTSEREDRLAVDDAAISLTTISSPFGGIEASSHCGSDILAWLSLGLVKPLCHVITGAKYKEIPSNAEFMRNPGELLPVVGSHLKIATDEANTCRRYDEDDVCIEDDFVFSLEEQSQAALEGDRRLDELTVKAGHVEIVGDAHTVPGKLIEILQSEGILKPTPAESQAELAKLLARLYLAH